MAEDSRDTHAESDNMSSEGAGAGGGAAGGAVGQGLLAHWASGFDTLLLFLGLPSQVFVVLLLEALNSYRNFGLRFVQYNYFVNEFGLSDTETGSLLGIKSTLDVVFGISGSLATDALGVRKTALFALCMATVGRCLLAFGRSRSQLYLACLFFSPFGEAFLSVGLYKVALKRLTTPRIRPLAFAIQYATFNFAGALCDVFIDHLRHQNDVLWFGQVFTGLRIFVVTTWVAVVVALVLAWFLLQDVTVCDPEDPEPAACSGGQEASGAAEDKAGRVCLTKAREEDRDDIQLMVRGERDSDEAGAEDGDKDGGAGGDDAGARASARRGTGVKGLPHVDSVACSVSRTGTATLCESERGNWVERGLAWRAQAVARYEVKPSVLRSDGAMARLRQTAASHGYRAAGALLLSSLWSDVAAAARLRQLWMAITFSLCSFFVGKQWAELEMVMPAFLERYFGEGVPIYTIHSINLWGCMLLPPLVGAVTGNLEAFRVILPGMWIMAASPLPLMLSPSVTSAILWNIGLTLGEVLWSPRQNAWIMTLAPAGREGIFLAFASLKDLLITWPSTLFLGYINGAFNANCRSLGCRDQYGHFCDAYQASEASCVSSQAVCSSLNVSSLVTGADGVPVCPHSCQQCPGWEGQAETLWGIILFSSLLSPLLVWLFLPFLRPETRQQGSDRWCAGVMSCSVSRVKSICGF